MKNIIGDKRKCIWTIAVGILLLVYVGIFVYLNMEKYAQHVDSDIAAEAFWAREIWEGRTLTPDNWIASTKRYIFGMPMVAAMFYGITGSMETAVGIACVLIGAVFLGVLYWVLRKLGISRVAALTALLVICAIPINGLRNDGQMVPFVALLLFLFADYYALHSILLFASMGFYLHLKQKGVNGGALNRRDILTWVFLFGFTTVLACGEQRSLQMVILPLAIYEVISLFADSEGFSKKPGKGRFYATGYAATAVAGYLISTLYKGQVNYTMYLQKPEEVLHRLFVTVPAALLEGFGIAGGEILGNFGSLMQLLVWAFIALVIYGVVYILRQKNGVAAVQKEALLLLLTSLGTTMGIICITTTEAAHNYLLVEWFVALFVVAVLTDAFGKRKSLFADVILAAVCGFALLNILYTWKDAVTTTDNLQEYEEVADFMLEEGIEYGYAEFWDAGRISMIKDGAITMGHSYVMEDLKMYWWLTSTEWYPPNLPEEMKTAYVVKTAKKDAFISQFADPAVVELQFENETFAVYVSEHNLMKIQ